MLSLTYRVIQWWPYNLLDPSLPVCTHTNIRATGHLSLPTHTHTNISTSHGSFHPPILPCVLTSFTCRTSNVHTLEDYNKKAHSLTNYCTALPHKHLAQLTSLYVILYLWTSEGQIEIIQTARDSIFTQAVLETCYLKTRFVLAAGPASEWLLLI